jgi:hypothetical protein
VTSPAPRPTHEQVEADLVVAEQPFLHDRSTVAGALLHLAAEVHALRAELAAADENEQERKVCCPAACPVSFVGADSEMQLIRHVTVHPELAARTPQPAADVGAEARGVLWMAMRYALGRRTYAAQEVGSAIAQHAHRLEPWQRERMAQEIERELGYDAEGAAWGSDAATWWQAVSDLRAPQPVVPDAGQAPPVYLALDVWQALHLPVGEFDGYYQRNGWAETWAALMAGVRGPAQCGRPVDGEVCVLAPHSESAPCYGARDVGSSEPLPFLPAVPDGEDQRDRRAMHGEHDPCRCGGCMTTAGLRAINAEDVPACLTGWTHEDGTPCAVFLATRPFPEPGKQWWCTEHEQRLHVDPSAPVSPDAPGGPRLDELHRALVRRRDRLRDELDEARRIGADVARQRAELLCGIEQRPAAPSGDDVPARLDSAADVSDDPYLRECLFRAAARTRHAPPNVRAAVAAALYGDTP